jgi:hypothetical protein
MFGARTQISLQMFLASRWGSADGEGRIQILKRVLSFEPVDIDRVNNAL